MAIKCRNCNSTGKVNGFGTIYGLVPCPACRERHKTLTDLTERLVGEALVVGRAMIHDSPADLVSLREMCREIAEFTGRECDVTGEKSDDEFLPHLKSVANAITRARNETGMTIGDLAIRLRVADSIVEQWEAGNTGPSPSMRALLAGILHVPESAFDDRASPEFP